MTIRATLSFVSVVTVLALAANAADDKKEAPKAGTADAKFERFKQLAGDWVGKAGSGKDAHDAKVNYKVVSGGTAVVETIDTDHGEMVTVIYKDGDDLVLTHYCTIGNQPHMKAERGGDDNTIAFKFVSCSNMKSDKDFHMHNVTFTIVDKDTLKGEWTHYMDGKEGGKVAFDMKRKK